MKIQLTVAQLKHQLNLLIRVSNYSQEGSTPSWSLFFAVSPQISRNPSSLTSFYKHSVTHWSILHCRNMSQIIYAGKLLKSLSHKITTSAGNKLKRCSSTAQQTQTVITQTEGDGPVRIAVMTFFQHHKQHRWWLMPSDVCPVEPVHWLCAQSLKTRCPLGTHPLLSDALSPPEVHIHILCTKLAGNCIKI